MKEKYVNRQYIHRSRKADNERHQKKWSIEDRQTNKWRKTDDGRLRKINGEKQTNGDRRIDGRRKINEATQTGK